ncbi:MAG: GWxTD domain-containing protein [Gemmatimonadetes bacterium]|nr:GWxTD domain-containing protein [Gemmatimonadota bacterium]
MPTVARPLEVYDQLGMLAGPQEFPGVASFATLAGPADSTYVLFGLSLPSSALRFQRDGQGFVAEYTVALTFLRDTVRVKRLDERQVVRVSSFAETSRTDESIIFQAALTLAPGSYVVDVEARDAFSSRALLARDTLEVPSHTAPRRNIGMPVVVYAARGRGTTEGPPELTLNPRRTLPYGGNAPLVYLEAYDSAASIPVNLRVVDEHGAVLWQSQFPLQDGGGGVRHALVEVPPISLPLGRLWLELASAVDTQAVARSPLLVTISDQWMVANFEEMLQFLAYIAHAEELDSLRAGSTSQRRELWERFWSRRDPIPATPINEYREEFFERVRFTTDQFAEPARPGWQTDRGEVFIVLGAPDHEVQRQVRQSGVDAAPTAVPNALEWIYENAPGGRLELLFIDRAGFGRYELTSSSQQAFRAAARRLRPRPEGK